MRQILALRQRQAAVRPQQRQPRAMPAGPDPSRMALNSLPGMASRMMAAGSPIAGGLAAAGLVKGFADFMTGNTGTIGPNQQIGPMRAGIQSPDSGLGPPGLAPLAPGFSNRPTQQTLQNIADNPAILGGLTQAIQQQGLASDQGSALSYLQSHPATTYDPSRTVNPYAYNLGSGTSGLFNDLANRRMHNLASIL